MRERGGEYLEIQRKYFNISLLMKFLRTNIKFSYDSIRLFYSRINYQSAKLLCL